MTAEDKKFEINPRDLEAIDYNKRRDNSKPKVEAPKKETGTDKGDSL